jgi:hypothetical protein
MRVMGGRAMRVVGNKEGEGGMVMGIVTRMAGKAVAMATRVVSKDEGNGKGKKCDGKGNKDGDCKEAGNGKQQGQQDDGNRDNNDNHNNNGNKYNDNNDDADNDNEDNNKDKNNNSVVAAAGGGWRGQWRWQQQEDAEMG